MNFDFNLIERFIDGENSADEFLVEFLKALKKLPYQNCDRNKELRREISLRLASMILTDDERASLLQLPPGCRIREGAKILSKENLKIGENCWIGENAILDASGGLEIGSNTSIGLGVFVWSHAGHLSNLSGENKIGSSKIIRKKTVIGSNCCIFGPSVILPGVTIGDKCVIRPLSRIEQDVPSRSVI